MDGSIIEYWYYNEEKICLTSSQKYKYMGCSTCAVSGSGTPTGCGNKGHCSSGSCNKMNTFDWLTTLELEDPSCYHIVEVSFKKGTRKAFFLNPDYTRAITGDMVVVESSNGYDVGRISLSGDLVRLQMKKKRVNEDRVIHNVVRIANNRDLSKLEEARAKEKPSMIQARKLAKTLNVNMKIGEVEYQGDLRKATFYYIADGRVDFRELVRVFAKEFRVKIEMRQIGSRQESGLVGGVGACGRELCCSTWLSDFSSVTTNAARYQNIAINQTKLSGQCGRLKCCLNFELDMYVEALDQYPKNANILRSQNGKANLIKVDIFAKLMYYAHDTGIGRNVIVGLTKEQVLEYKAMNDNKQYPETFVAAESLIENDDKGYADVTGAIELPEEKRKRRGNRNKRNNKRDNNRSRPNNRNKANDKTENKGEANSDQKPNPQKDKQSRPPRNKRNKPRGPRKDNDNPQGKVNKQNKEHSNKSKQNVNQDKERSNKPSNKQDSKPNNRQNNPNKKQQGSTKEGNIKPQNNIDQAKKEGNKPNTGKRKFFKKRPNNNKNSNNTNDKNDK